MFGAKSTFGGGTGTTGFGGTPFNTNTAALPFGQSTFGKPATSTFGAAPAFGGQQTTPSMFGSNAGQTQSTGLFGGTSTGFGNTSTAQPTFGGFNQAPQNTSIFSAQSTANTSSLFSQPTTSAFGSAVKPSGLSGFGQTTAPSNTSLFGAPSTSTSTTGFASFGQTAPTTGSVFGNANTSAFGQPPIAGGTNAGTSIAKYQPAIGTDTLMKGGQANNVNTKQHCITAMKEYELKSLEELRMEDYLANRKGGASTSGGFFGTTNQPGTAPGTSLFGATNPPTQGLFGQPAAGQPTDNKTLFGTSTFGQQPNTQAFGTTVQQQNSFMAKPFGSTTTNAFGAPNATGDSSANPFGAKPAFSQGTGLFGQNTAANPANTFGQTNTGFGGFGSTAGTNQQPNVFGAPVADANKPTFGLGTSSTANTSFGGFGTSATSTAGGGGLFGGKPAGGAFGVTPAFGATTQPSGTGFGGFSMNTSAAGNASTGLFNSSLNKPATSTFGGFGQQTSTAPLNFNVGSSGGSSFFGGNTANKPGGLFGGTLGGGTANTTGGGLFGGAGSAFNTGSSLGGLGTGTFGTGNTSLGGGLGGCFNVNNQLQQPQTVPIHQQILAKVTSPYGDNPIFKDLKRSDETDATRATNPAAQQSILDSVTHNQFKLTSKPSPLSIKVTPIGSALTKKSLFDGLEEFDASVESFSLKPNAKRLILKPNQSKDSNMDKLVTLGVGTPQETNVLNTSINRNQLPLDNQRNEVLNLESTIPTVNPIPAPLPNDYSRRESWLHPNNLEKVRQHNLNNSGIDAAGPSPLNNSISELVPRKPIETYKGQNTSGNSGSHPRLSMSTVPENPFEDQPSSVTRITDNTTGGNDSLFYRSHTGEDQTDEDTQQHTIEYDEHPTGIALRRVGYYTIPSMDDLKSYLAEDGSCIVPNFTIGREGYGNVYFGKEMDVANINIDEIVHFRNKEIIIYPDDDKKPPIGSGLNREAQVTLDQVWPHDKTKHEPIKDPQRLCEMDWESKLRRVCDKNDTRFIEYRPETGSWVFRVKHFSKYGLNDSDEEDDPVPTDPKKAKMGVVTVKATQNINIAGRPGDSTPKLLQGAKVPEANANSKLYPMDESADFMLMDKTQFLQNAANNNLNTDYATFQSPTTAIARDQGMDSYKLQLMKASLFAEDEQTGEDDDNESMNSEISKHPCFQMNRRSTLINNNPYDMYDASQSYLRDRPPSEASSRIDFEEMLSPQILPISSTTSVIGQSDTPFESSAMYVTEQTKKQIGLKYDQKLAPIVIKPQLAKVKLTNFVNAPHKKSFAYPLRLTWSTDRALYYSRFFKFNFGPQNTMIIPSTKFNLNPDIKNANLFDVAVEIFKPRNHEDYSKIILQHVKISSIAYYESFKESISGHLNIELNNSCFEEVEGSECPYIKSSNGTELITQHLDEAIKQINVGTLEEYAVSVWSLCLSLWGEHEEFEGHDSNAHLVIMSRRNLLSEWLENTLTSKDLLTKTVSKHTYLDYMIELILCHKVTEACELAIRYDDGNLALLLSQLSSGTEVRQLMEDQLAAWNTYEADKFIHLERLKLFMLVAGVSLMTSSKGPINILDGLDWIKTIAIQLWYLSSPTASITDALLSYEKSFQSSEFYSLPPNPAYFEKEDALISKNPNKSPLYDLRYHLLKLYSKRSHPMECLLNPATHTPDPMDYRLSWLMLQTLEALGYRHCGELSESQIHVGFACQLETNDMWEWAIFILLHIKNKNQRELTIQNILYRYASISQDGALNDKEKFVINNLGIPEKWLDYAKAVKAGAMGKRHLQAKYLLKAKQWSLAHEIIFQYIAPDAVINDNLEYLYELLHQFEGNEMQRNIKVPNWSNQGQIFLDFIDITEKFTGLKSLKTEADIETRWENFKPQLADLCSRINLLPCPTSKHRLCQSEIAQSLACLIRGVLLVCPVLNPCLIIKIALERLPLPQEFAKQELRALLDTLVKDLAKTNLASRALTTGVEMDTNITVK